MKAVSSATNIIDVEVYKRLCPMQKRPTEIPEFTVRLLRR